MQIATLDFIWQLFWVDVVLFLILTRVEPLQKNINRYKKAYLAAAFLPCGAAYGFLKLEAKSAGLCECWSALISPFLGKPVGLMGAAAIAFLSCGGILVGMVLRCRIRMDRDPRTFPRVGDRQKILNTYVRRLNYCGVVLVSSGDHGPKRIAERCDLIVLAAILTEIGVEISSGDQLQNWRETGENFRKDKKNRDALECGKAHGRESKEVSDFRVSGGFFFAWIRQPEQVQGGLYVFASTLRTREMDEGKAQKEFNLILEALRYHEDEF